ARKRRRFEEAAARRLNRIELLKRAGARPRSHRASDGIARWTSHVSRLPHGNERRQRVADHRQAQPCEPFAWTRGELEWQLPHDAPSVRAQATGDGERRENRNREGPIVAVSGLQRFCELLRRESASGAAEPGFSGRNRSANGAGWRWN